MPKYKHDVKVDRILKVNNAETQNVIDKEFYNNVVKVAAVGLKKNYKSKNSTVANQTKQVIKYLAENLDGRSFTQLNKHVHDLRADVLSDPNLEITADNFLIFLDKIRDLTPSKTRNQQIMMQFEKVDIALMTPARLMANYQ